MSSSVKLTKTEIREELKSAEVYPTGPVSAWPQERHNDLVLRMNGETAQPVRASFKDMAKGLVRTAGQGIRYGRVSGEIREERYDTCKKCPYFLEDSKRCSECGCFMEAKTWVGGDPDLLCPKKKWSR
tara:strand:+ start:1700 stop:2083 length:384 start_codon:yes stop_codon:yes gene_type:complete